MLCVRVAIIHSRPLRQDGAIATLEMTQMTQLSPKKVLQDEHGGNLAQDQR